MGSHDVPDHDARTLLRGDFALVTRMTTRWADNDAFGHLNNAVYYVLFDTALGAFQQAAGIDETRAPALGVVAESSARYYAEVAYPSAVDVGIRVERLGTKSLTYEMGLFAEGVDAIACHSRWVCVYIDRETRRTIPVPDPVRALADLPLLGGSPREAGSADAVNGDLDHAS